MHMGPLQFQFFWEGYTAYLDSRGTNGVSSYLCSPPLNYKLLQMGWASDPGSVFTLLGFGVSMFFIVYVFTRVVCRRLQAAAPQPAPELDLEPTVDVEQVCRVERKLFCGGISRYPNLSFFDSQPQPQPQPRVVGLDPALVAEIPTAKFSGGAFSMEDSQ
ncbi:hypothetical protein SAY87_010942 [Trapa incisa]|uniref:Uncharacterized protein n=1 Tax=Trapa incisa TaxID=236973 RepID=A0AAN7GKC2_9MYRT|nr:hypothetical protein SAY87_010942 [Trapa incisa]